ncbi:D-alanyl-D-alanine carboxypeptidase/D-alanyl-D-alanine endopeptidase [Halobacillus faecis]|uniref:D-alanyl-D-alanine carboxypeptidase DacC n=1 Tax=Halobacillus faecis TaxID=360184 RepID=A0A511WPY1_9BACI|nr:D-alanyl-D-alanine carboxypeptidase/D-alanyl-D-alanine-endopeptidase [Halobacillus faecis]GEN52521.1 D-alanyl-D-alanine carboxypeptidase DacC [Halobacillus faecis]
MKDKIDRLLEGETLHGAMAGVSIRHAVSGEVVYEKNGHLRLTPASNTKLFTGAAALETLGPEHAFTTGLWTDGVIEDGTLKGNLYLKGKGDPSLTAEDLDAMAVSLRKKGIKEVTGEVIADDSWYDKIRLSPGILWSQESEYYASQVSALTVSPDQDYDTGTVLISVSPAHKEGQAATIEVTPGNEYVEILNRTKTGTSKTEDELKVEREHGTNTIVVEGTMAIDDPVSKSWISVLEPTGLVIELFYQSLVKEGIVVKGSHAKFPETPKQATRLYEHSSMPLKELFLPFMKLSNNGHAEVLVKEMGKVVHDEGSWEKGLEVVEAEMRHLGVNMDTIQLNDGSGMSATNFIPAHEISQLLFQVQEKEWFPEFRRSLPVAGNEKRFEGGTLRHRMQGTEAEGNVRAKTGTLSGVSSLSGYVTTKDGEPLIFAMVFNHFLAEDVDEIEDRLAVILSEHQLSVKE